MNRLHFIISSVFRDSQVVDKNYNIIMKCLKKSALDVIILVCKKSSNVMYCLPSYAMLLRTKRKTTVGSTGTALMHIACRARRREGRAVVASRAAPRRLYDVDYHCPLGEDAFRQELPTLRYRYLDYYSLNLNCTLI